MLLIDVGGRFSVLGSSGEHSLGLIIEHRYDSLAVSGRADYLSAVGGALWRQMTAKI